MTMTPTISDESQVNTKLVYRACLNDSIGKEEEVSIQPDKRQLNKPICLEDSTYLKKDDVHFEDVLEHCCGTGRWQTLLIGYMSIMWLLFPTLSVSMMFVGASPNFKCADGFDLNASYADLPDDTPRCQAFNSTSECSRWVYDTSVYLSTVVTEWNLVCSRKPLLSMLQSWLMIGAMVGSVISGQVTDSFGRRMVFLPGMVLITACVFCSALASSYALFAAIRFLTGVAMAAMVGSLCVIVTELSSASRRALLGLLVMIPFSFGTCFVAAASYLVRTRWLLQMTYAVPFLLLIPNFWIMPESPRWLVHHAKFGEAFAVLKTGAKWNCRQMPPEEEVHRLMNAARDGMLAREATSKNTASENILTRLSQLVRTPRMRRYTLASNFVMFVIAGSYFGIAFDTTQLSTSPHLAATLSGLAEFPAYFCFPLLNRFGRRPSMVGFLAVAAFSMLLVFVAGDAPLWLALGLIAKFGVSCAFAAILVYLSEFMPTEVRGLAFGVSQTANRVGATVSPFVVDLVSELHPAAPSGVFGGFVLLAGLTCLLLPETRGKPMPESVADVEDFAKESEPGK